ncbi:hypothetical protein [Spiroplasma endosymbiont of Amphimallon solstitiale]|uniref:hypothetical protein n=1 Tax=Spiroplasma endosymbiont of Amphimallon solstitiale TaxID=3066288 RepID=UPI00313CB4E5
MSKFEKQKIEQSINYFKENIENCYEKISSLEKKKIWNIDFYDWNKEINSKIKLQNNIIEYFFNYVEKYGWPKIIHQFTLKILFLIKNLLKVTLFSVKIL